MSSAESHTQNSSHHSSCLFGHSHSSVTILGVKKISAHNVISLKYLQFSNLAKEGFSSPCLKSVCMSGLESPLMLLISCLALVGSSMRHSLILRDKSTLSKIY